MSIHIPTLLMPSPSAPLLCPAQDKAGNMLDTEFGSEEPQSPESRVKKLKSFLQWVYRLHAGNNTNSPLKGLIKHIIEGQVSPEGFTRDLQSITRIQLRPGTVSFLHSSLPYLRLEYKTMEKKEQLCQFVFQSKATPALTSSDKPVKKRKLPVIDARELEIPKRKCVGGGGGGGWTGGGVGGEGGLGEAERDGSPLDLWAWHSDEWRHIENLFTSLVSTMERLRYAMLLFQQRSRLSQVWTQQLQHKHNSHSKIEQVQRKAEAVVQEVKKVAVAELQRAVAAAEAKAEGMVEEERRRNRETQSQEASLLNCWNCGRKAGQTCGGCGVGRYCGEFCQHKDWATHRLTCSKRTPLEVKREVPSPLPLPLHNPPPPANSGRKSV